MKNNILIAIIVVFTLSGCASGVKRIPNGPGESHVGLTGDNQISSIFILLKEDAQQQAVDNPIFSQKKLLSSLELALDTYSLLNSATDKSRPRLEVQIKNIHLRSNFTAWFWGVIAGPDIISADIVLKDLESKDLDRFEVTVAYSLGGSVGGSEIMRMGWLYSKFAEETVKELMRK
jgi:hypothetical protein